MLTIVNLTISSCANALEASGTSQVTLISTTLTNCTGPAAVLRASAGVQVTLDKVTVTNNHMLNATGGPDVNSTLIRGDDAKFTITNTNFVNNTAGRLLWIQTSGSPVIFVRPRLPPVLWHLQKHARPPRLAIRCPQPATCRPPPATLGPSQKHAACCSLAAACHTLPTM